MTIIFFEIKTSSSEDQMEKIFAREWKICEFQKKSYKKVAQTGRIFTDLVNKEFYLSKSTKK